MGAFNPKLKVSSMVLCFDWITCIHTWICKSYIVDQSLNQMTCTFSFYLIWRKKSLVVNYWLWYCDFCLSESRVLMSSCMLGMCGSYAWFSTTQDVKWRHLVVYGLYSSFSKNSLIQNSKSLFGVSAWVVNFILQLQLQLYVVLCKFCCYIVNGWLQEMSAADEQHMKRQVLQSSSVICTTLNHSGSKLLLDVLKPFSSNGRMIVPLGCIIVDEVHSCTCITVCILSFTNC